MGYVKALFDTFASHGGMLFMLWVAVLLIVYKKINELTLTSWNGFLDSLDRHGGHILVGCFWTMVGIIMLKVALIDDGKAVIGFGLGILSRSMGTHAPTPTDPNVGNDGAQAALGFTKTETGFKKTDDNGGN